jgi:hypothetical protein
MCYEVLANESFNVSKLVRNLKTTHGSVADRDAEKG